MIKKCFLPVFLIPPSLFPSLLFPSFFFLSLPFWVGELGESLMGIGVSQASFDLGVALPKYWMVRSRFIVDEEGV